MITITRKIQLNVNEPDAAIRKSHYEKLRHWNFIVFKAANLISSHHFLQEELKQFFYLTEEAQRKIADISKDEAGLLTTSRTNSTYQVLSKLFKGEVPMNIMTSINSTIVKTFNKERGEYFSGTRSLRSYRKEIPIPFGSAHIRNLVKQDDGNYVFDLFGIPFKTYFGKDLSGNEIILDRAVTADADYKLCDSSLQFSGKKLFWLAVFQFEKDNIELDKERELRASLSVETPIEISIGNKQYRIGNKDEYLYRRLAIQGALRRTQTGARYNRGGKGRKVKLQATDHFKLLEKNYITTRIHQYTAKLIDFCIKLKCGKLVLVNQEQKEEEAKADQEFLLRNWTYYGMKEKLEYKCRKAGIELVVE